ncbi:O-antigen ligase family protein [Planosporangium thailandense]|uniref:O-antigen ligase family protein n=1 Tax=Planosporangium thailandense TaxID=765197 RepID=A0ABX0Y877_9ACTN|nr:O-antigen ligase family protein [Planosporangium thailandense]
MTPLLVYLLLRQQTFYAVVGFAVTLPLLIVARPGQVALMLTPVVTLLLGAPIFQHGSQIVTGAVAALVIGVFLHLRSGSARLRADHVVVGLLSCVLLVSLLFPAEHLNPVSSPRADLMTLLEGLILLSVTLAAPPLPRRVAHVSALTGAAAAIWTLIAGAYEGGRLVGLTLNTNYLGAAFAVPAVMAIGVAWASRRPLWLLAALPSLVGLAATRSRGAMIATAAGIVVLVLAHVRRARRSVQVAVATALVAAVAGGLALTQLVGLGSRSTEELTYNNEVRAQAAQFAVHVALHHPLRGIGYLMFPPYAGLASNLNVVINTHDDFLRLAAEAGLPALLVFLFLLWRGARRLRGIGRNDITVLCAAVVTYAVGLLFANTLSNLIVTTPFWLALGTLMSHAPDQRGTLYHSKGGQGMHAEPAAEA